LNTLDDTAYAVLSYASKLSDESNEWRTAYERIREAVNILVESNRIYEKTGINGSKWIQDRVRILLESIKSEDLPKTISTTSEILDYGRRKLASLYMLYRSMTAIILGASLGGLVLAILSLPGLTTQIGGVVGLSIIGILVATLLIPPRYARTSLALAGALLLTLPLIEGGSQKWELILYGILLLSTPVSIEGFRRV